MIRIQQIIDAGMEVCIQTRKDTSDMRRIHSCIDNDDNTQPNMVAVLFIC